MEQNYFPQGDLATQVAAAQNASQELSKRQSSKSKKKKFAILFVIVLLAGIGVYLIVKGLGSKEELTIVASPSPTVAGISNEMQDSAGTPIPAADKGTISIQILNGTGIPGEASFLQAKLKALGYTKVDAGNASSNDNETTTVTFSSSLSPDVVSELTDLLKETYKSVETKTSSSLTGDAQVVTGLRAGQTPVPSATATATAKATASPTPTSLPSPTGSQ